MLSAFFGSHSNALGAPVEELSRIHGIGAKLAFVIHNWERYCDPEDEMSLASMAGVSILMEEDACYPPLLREIHDPPLCLYVRGSADLLAHTECSVAIVGSRNASPYGRRMAEKLAMEASYAGSPVVSGLARGIDTAAHEAAIRAGGSTVAVIGSGLANVYPPENIPLAMSIAKGGGAVVSEFPMKYQADKRSFPMRNRIISGISKGTIVVEAGVKSGSLITAASAMEQNRTVFAVPGLADSFSSKGCHALIRDGAVLTESFKDVIDDFTGLPGMKPPPPERQSSPLPPPDEARACLSGLELKLWDMIKQGELMIDNLIYRSEEAPACVSAALLALELKRFIRQVPGRRIRVLL